MAVNAPIIFVVDDERVIAETLTTILQRQGFAARLFLDPNEALSAALAEPPDLLLSDVMMPGMTGVELAITLRKLHPQCKVVLFSGQAQTEDLLHDARRQGHDFLLLLKPIHPVELLRRIREQTLVSA